MSEGKLFTEQRRRDILRLIRRNGSANVNALAGQFGVSGTTIRLDLTALEETGAIQRTHGGAVLSEPSMPEPSISEREHQREKARIAQRALRHISNNDVLLVDTGTTMLALAQALAQSALTGLTVYTNDIDVLRTLEVKENWALYLLGGRVRNGFHYTYSDWVVRELGSYHFKKLFLATSAMSLTAGLTTANSELAALKAAMVAASETVYLLADASKLHRVDFQKFAELTDVDALIIDDGVDPADAEALGEFIPVVERAGQ